jgi:multidrug efflux pump subunit AcrA (membrane-fusion protein)
MKRFLIILPIFLMILFLSGCMSAGKREPQTQEVTAVVITYPAPSEIVRTVRFSGSLKGSREVMVYPNLPGKLLGYALSDGGYVSKGGTVATLDRDIPGIEYEPVPVEAPISGRFFSLGLSPGEMVAPQVPIGRISETGELKLEFNVPEKYVANVREGSKTKVYVPSVAYEATGTLTRISRFVEARSGAAQAEATVSNPSGELAPGMFAEIDVAVASKDAKIALPVDCVLGLDGRFVYIVKGIHDKPDTSIIDKVAARKSAKKKVAQDTVITMVKAGRAVKRDVQTGLDDGEFVEILSGLEPTDAVLFVGQRIVKEGEEVMVTSTYKPGEQEK